MSFIIRAVYTFAPDRIYRVELCNDSMYFLRIGSQFDLDTSSIPARRVSEGSPR